MTEPRGELPEAIGAGDVLEDSWGDDEETKVSVDDGFQF